MSSKRCRTCGGSDIDVDRARGDVVCMGCGSVLEDNIMVSEVEFVATAGRGISAVGQHVSAEGGAKPPSFADAHFSGMDNESRAQTLRRARHQINDVGHRLQMNQHCLDTAFTFYKMALNKCLTQGRPSSHVIAACIYMVCRTEGTPHMLLDLSDLLQVNIYMLGKTFLFLARKLCINTPAIDPCLYIPRFAQMLDFGENNHKVSMTAMRLVQRMKGQWMHMGRRPSGLCGAALLVAARMHSFPCTVKEVVNVVKVCETTLRKRLSEFEDTPTSELIIEEFMKTDLDEECDPPCFLAGLQKKETQQLEVELEKKMADVEGEIYVFQDQIDAELESSRPKLRGVYASYVNESYMEDYDDPEEEEELQDMAKHFGKDADELTLEALVKLEQRSPEEEEPSLESIVGSLPSTATLGLSESISTCMASEKENDGAADSGELDLTGIDDSEIEQYLLSDKEIQIKTALWMVDNSDYLKEQEVKEAKIAKEKELGIYKEKKARGSGKRRAPIQASTADEAIGKMLKQKKLSSMINYDVLKDLDIKPGTSPARGSESPKTTPSSTKPLARNRNVPPSPLGIVGKRLQPFVTGQPSKKLAVEQVASSKPLPLPVVVESGPVAYEDAAVDEDEDEDEEVNTGLFGSRGYGGDADYDEGF